MRLRLVTAIASRRPNQILQLSWHNRLAAAVVLLAAQCRHRVQLSLVLDRVWVAELVRVVTAPRLGLTAHLLLANRTYFHAITCQRNQGAIQRLAILYFSLRVAQHLGRSLLPAA